MLDMSSAWSARPLATGSADPATASRAQPVFFFSTAQDADLLNTSSPRKKAAEQVRTNCSVTLLGVSSAVFQHGAAHVELVHAILGEVTGLHVVAEFAFAPARGDVRGEQLEQGGFTCAIQADEDDALRSLGFKITPR